MVALVGASAPAFAQGQPSQPGVTQAPAGTSGGPRRAWFGNGAGRLGQNLSGRLSLGGGQIQQKLTNSVTFDETVRRSENWHASGGLTYGLTGSRASLAVSGGSNVQSFPALAGNAVISYWGLVNTAGQLSTRTNVSASVGAYREPTIARYFRGLFDSGSGQGLSPDIDIGDFGDVRDVALSYQATADLSQALTTHSVLSFGYAHRRSRYGSADQSQIHDNASARYRVSLTPSLGFHAGYRYIVSRSDLADAVKSEGHDIDAGIDFSKAFSLSLSPNTTLSFGTGSSIVRSRNQTRFVVTGNVGLTHRIGRSWSAGAHYSRNVRFLEGVTDIAVVDSLGADVGGSVSRRAGVGASVSATRGNVGLGSAQNPFRGLTARVGTSVAASTNVGVSINYTYFRSRFDRADFLLSPDLRAFERHSAGVSVGFWGLVAVGVNYTNYNRQLNHNQAVLASVTLFAPLYARVRRF